ncbi:MAG: hypothetical protein K0S07_894 [Chlamydiales bacterium]|jgi:hypothetical protein|nr:hypothetical protein [Chlamydiales bacterium]
MDSNSINHINQLFQPEEKYFLKASGRQVEIVPLKDTTWWERKKAKYGFGPLSLTKIAPLILNQDPQALPVTDLAQKKEFYAILKEQCLKFNSQHFFRSIQLEGFAKVAACTNLAEVAQVYSSQEDSPCTLSYADQALGFAYIAHPMIDVADGIVIQPKAMAAGLQKHFTNFHLSFAEDLKERAFENTQDAAELLSKHLMRLAEEISKDETVVATQEEREYALCHKECQPAVSFAQILRVGSKKYMLTFQRSHTSLLIHKKEHRKEPEGLEETDQWILIKNGKADIGLGSGADPTENRTVPLNHIESIQYEIFIEEVKAGDAVFGFSEMLNLEEMKQKITHANGSTYFQMSVN